MRGAARIPDRRSATYYLRSVNIGVVTIFPEFFESPLEISLVARAIESGRLEVELLDLRAHGFGAHRQVDDAPFGGGPGMVMMVEPIVAALRTRGESHRVLLTPAGMPLDQAMLDRWASLDRLTLVCGRYEGVDDRIGEHYVDEQVSLGDFVIAGGEVAALTIIEGIARLLPGILGNPESTAGESFRDGLLEEPTYTRPAEFEGHRVPPVLLSGDHGAVAAWRAEQRRIRTEQRRPDLLDD